LIPGRKASLVFVAISFDFVAPGLVFVAASFGFVAPDLVFVAVDWQSFAGSARLSSPPAPS
jgi:hypothetical protein